LTDLSLFYKLAVLTECRLLTPFVRFPLIDYDSILTVTEPPLSPAERAIVKSYGGWTQFMMSFGLKPWESDDAEEGKRILEGFTEYSEEDAD
jgi:hypothetical protein